VAMKTIVLFQRRPELTPAQFQDYYETRHAPLAVQHIQFSKYVRNYLITPAAEFDVLSEFWLADPNAAAALSASAAGATLKADEARFMRAERFAASAEETLLAGPPRGVEAGQVQKYIVMFQSRAGISEPDFAAAIQTWGQQLAADLTPARVTADIVKPLGNGSFPADAIVSIWPGGSFDAGKLQAWPNAVESARTLTVAACETPSDNRVRAN
jgi:hypothetical protein